jgi:integrase
VSVRKRLWPDAKTGPNVRWVVDYRDAEGTRRLKTFTKKKDADQFAATARVEVRSGTHVAESASITVKEAADDWVKAVTVGRNGRSPAEASTLRQYRQHVDLHIVPEIGDLKLSKLTGPRVAAFRDHLLATMSRALAKKVLTSFKSMIKEAQARGNIIANPAASISIQSTGDSRHKVEVEIPTRDEVRALLVKLDELATQSNLQRAKAWRRYRALIATAIHTGFRASELRGLPWAAVDLKLGTIEVRQRADENGVIGSPKSASSRRKISIPAPLVARLREWKAECPPGELVFPNWQGRVEALANIHTRAWKPLQVAADVVEVGKAGQKVPRYTFHALRHFRASLLIADGANPKEVQAELGHATIAVTMDTYATLFRDDAAELERRERAERLAQSLI